MPCLYCGLSLMLERNFGQNPDEKQAIVRFDVSNEKRRDVETTSRSHRLFLLVNSLIAAAERLDQLDILDDALSIKH
ncbi:hypothetical protein CHU32_17755 [Superficieibacter electus]|uniref:Uncharacterized protein n=1 Tax=Superficieibacter electus TaxID=2022662 RepID=A0A2P5GLZ1_9ENTR|nr:hypothetical protein CHU33_17655 [Superficieibacter electus]POP46562.1 hypothetical protein CHU32_17755 [Superficieibacter electus]